MKKVVVIVSAVFVLAITMATAAFAAQPSEAATAMTVISESLSRAVLQEPATGNVLGVSNLPSTGTGAADFGVMAGLALLAIGGGFALIRKAITDR